MRAPSPAWARGPTLALVLVVAAGCTSDAGERTSSTSPPSQPSGIPIVGTADARAAIVQFRPVDRVIGRADPAWARTRVTCDPGSGDPCSTDILEHDPRVVLLANDGTQKFVLGAVILTAADFAGLRPAQGPRSSWSLAIQLDGAGRQRLADATARVVANPPPRNEIAVVVDGRVAMAPQVQGVITSGAVSLAGAFTRAETNELAERIAKAGS